MQHGTAEYTLLVDRHRASSSSSRCSPSCGSCRCRSRRRRRSATAGVIPRSGRSTTTRRCSRAASTARAAPLINSILIALIATTIAVTLASFTAYAIARLNFPGKALSCSRRAGDLDVPADLRRRPAVRHVAHARPLRHVPGPDHPVPDVRAAAGDLHPVAFFREIPGISRRPPRSTAPRRSRPSGGSSCRWPRRACSRPRSSSSSSRGTTSCSRSRSPRRTLAHGPGGDRVLHRRVAVHLADREHRRRGGVRDHPDHHLRTHLPAPDRGRA